MFKRIVGALASGLLAAALAVTIFVAPGQAATAPVAVESTCLEGWYVNPDEGGADPSQGDRRPVQEEGGLSFTGNQLVHHAAPEGLTVDELEPGTFEADPEPSLASFFSVEVWGDGGYATLRWNTSTSKWDMVTGGQAYSHEDPAELVKMTDPDKSGMVRTFGVGYVNSPNDGTKTVVSSITFAGTTYDLTCEPEPTPSPSVTTPAATTPPATPPATDPAATPSGTVPPVAGGPSLPVTGVNLQQVVTGGILLLIGGAVAWLIAPSLRRRRQRFEA